MFHNISIQKPENDLKSTRRELNRLQSFFYHDMHLEPSSLRQNTH